MTTLAELTTVRTKDQVLTSMLGRLSALGFPATAWVSGSVARTILEVFAAGLADFSALVAAVARGGLLDLAAGAWLTLLARSAYALERTPAGFAAGTVRVTVAAGAGNQTWSAGGLRIGDSAGHRYTSTNAATLTINAGTYRDVEVRADTPGTAHNLASGTAVNLTPVRAGVSALLPDLGGGTWLTTQGTAEEADEALRQRCRDRWATLAVGNAPDAAYRYWCTSCADPAAVGQVAHVQVVEGPGDGTLTVYVAGTAGGLGGGVVDALQDWVDARRPLTDNPTVTSATAVPVAVTATVTVRAASDSTANRALATSALQALQAALGIGDDLDVGAVYHALYAAQGVVDVALSSPAADVVVGAGQVAVLGAPTLTWVVVA